MSPTGINYLNHFGNGESWNPITGCTHAGSPGCDNCWARRLHDGRNEAYWRTPGLMPEQYAEDFSTIQFHKKRLDQPSRWKKPRTIGVCFGGDLFHDSVPTSEIWHVFSAMRVAPQHTYLVLTKRPERMYGVVREMLMASSKDPDPNVWLGVTVCNQQEANEKIPILLDTPAAHRWVSYEPALGPVTFVPWLPGRMLRMTQDDPWFCSRCGCEEAEGVMEHECPPGFGPTLDWIVAGGESGKNARPDDPDWYRQVRDDCAAADVPFFMKQMAGRAPIPDDLMVRQLPWEPKT